MVTLQLLMTLTLGAASESVNDKLEEVQVTASRRSVSVSESGASVSVVNALQIEAVRPKVVTDALRGTPGLFVQQTTPGQGVPIVRGLKGSQVLHLVDGLRLNNAFFRSAPNQYLALVDPTNVERIEVVRGPGSTLYGSDAMGGVVQLLTKRPDYDQPLSWDGGFTFSSAELAQHSHLSLTQGSEDLAWRAHLAYLDSDDRRTGSGERLKPTAFRSESVSFDLRYGIDSERELLVGLDYLNQPSTPRIDEFTPGFGETEPASSEFFFEPNRRVALSAQYRQQNPWAWADELLLSVGAQRIDDDRRTRNFGASARRLEDNRSDLWSAALQLDKSVGWGELTWGLEVNRDEVSSARISQDIESGASTPITSRFPTGSSMRGSAVYGQALVNVGSQTEMTLGTRYSHFDIKLAQADRDVGAELSPDDVTFSIGLRHALSDQTALIANIGEGFRAPNIFDLATLGARPGNRFNIANPGLGPENVLSSELGIKRSADRYRMELFAFYSDFDDKITSVDTGDLTADGRMIVQSQNAATAELYGLEFGLRYLLSDTLELTAAANWVRGEERSADGESEPGDRIPPANGMLGLDWAVADRWSLNFRSDFADRQDRLSNRDVGDPRINPNGTSGWATFGTGVSYQISDRWQTQLSVDNLFDKQYREHGSGIDALGRNIGLTLSTR